MAIYEDADAGANLGAISASCASAGVVAATVGTFTMTQGTAYRMCICGTSSGVGYLAIIDQTAGAVNPLLNVFTTSIGAGANSCSTGVTPSTTGALTGFTNHFIPLGYVAE